MDAIENEIHFPPTFSHILIHEIKEKGITLKSGQRGTLCTKLNGQMV
jgi:hypothetical protein